MIVINGKGAVLGRLASYAAKEALKGNEIAIVNCDEIIITGNKLNITEKLEEKRKRVGSTQKGQKYSRLGIEIVKKTIRGMLPTARRSGRGRDAFKKIKGYNGIPKEFESSKMIDLSEDKNKFVTVKEISR